MLSHALHLADIGCTSKPAYACFSCAYGMNLIGEQKSLKLLDLSGINYDLSLKAEKDRIVWNLLDSLPSGWLCQEARTKESSKVFQHCISIS